MSRTISEIILHNRINRQAAQSGRHAILAANARERAIIALRLLAGESNWSDGDERRLDDCFEMNDGDDVVRWLLRFASDEPFVNQLLSVHRNVGIRCLTEWREKYEGLPSGELALV